MKILLGVILIAVLNSSYGQQFNASVGDGIAVVGYVDKGAYLNFTGPNVNFKSGNNKFILGMLPSLRFKEDKGEAKNSFITPNLGVGLTYSYKALAFQLPFYYNPKTMIENGQWVIGFGMGVNFNAISAKQKDRKSN